jgi:uncharacterized protein
MIKWLLTLGIIVLVLMLWFGKGRSRGAARGNQPKKPKPGAQAMVSCAHCGLHLPRPEAVEGEGGRHYCCSEHRRLGPAG